MAHVAMVRVCRDLIPGLSARRNRLMRTWNLIVFVLLTSGCSIVRSLMPPPLVYLASNFEAFDELDPALAGNTIKVMYVTDRASFIDKATGDLVYTYGRSPSFALGTAEVILGPDLTWRELAEVANAGARRHNIPLRLGAVEEFVRTPPTPYPYEFVNGQFRLPAELQARIDADFERGGVRLREALGRSQRKEAFVYVHGVGNQFEDAVFVGAEFWHYLGRQGIPIVYSWPAGRGGLSGYAYDRESSEFTVAHFREFLQGLASYRELEKIHIIAHSRGTDVVSSALRELFAETRAAGLDPKEVFRIGNLVLAAPDLDLSVVQQRSSRVSFGVDRLTVYTSKQDRAIGIASWLFGGETRVGNVGLDDITPEMREALSGIQNVSMIQYTGTKGGEHGHGYFRLNPAVASDVVLLLRYNFPPGAENGRPLIPRGDNFWEIDDLYLRNR